MDVEEKMAFEKLFQKRVEELLTEGDDALHVFKGFGLEQVRWLADCPGRLLPGQAFLAGGTLDVGALSESWVELVAAIQGREGPRVAFYEELLAVREMLPRVKAGKIVVWENNLFSPWSPSCLSYGEALGLFDFFQEEKEASDEATALLAQYYGDVKLLEGGRALVLPAVVESSQVEYRPFWTGEWEDSGEGEGRLIEAGSQADWAYRLDLLEGKGESCVLLQHGETLRPREQALGMALHALGISFSVDEVELYREPSVYHEELFLPLLRKYWGAGASFRPLLFYRDPDVSRETELLSQGQIIAEIADQCERSLAGEAYSNVFITAPTGSGKSILFQLPALYLAEKYQCVTIVVSPLIALMNDQVDQLNRERGVSIAACINSSMSMEERTAVIEEIRAGRKSLIYLAPELLLSTHLQTFLGGRAVGLVVIDEAHTVTSWGRDFRSDYWFLGDFLKKAKRDGLSFPVLCLTATAVYSGEDDVVNDTIQELGLERTILHLGNVRREDISFDIARHSREEAGAEGVEAAKLQMTLDRVRQYVSAGEKVLAYFPYKSQVEQAYRLLAAAEHGKIRRYHGQLYTGERRMVERSYKSGEAMGLLCTKAFGMGVDVGDIRHVIHFAPTGTLADYVQEIGRAARDPGLQGTAHIDYFPSDLRYVRALNSISEMRQYQLQEMLKKLCDLYQARKRRNLLVAAETFEYLFPETEVENRTKAGLMLLAKDINNRYSFPVLIVRPRAMLSKNYITVPAEIESAFLKKYGDYVQRQGGGTHHTLHAGEGSRASDVQVYSTGGVYLADMERIWERFYPEQTFGMFKRAFFEETFRHGGSTYHVAPRTRVEIRYNQDFEVIQQEVERIVGAFHTLFQRYKTGEVKHFTRLDFARDLEALLGEKALPNEKLFVLLDMFTETNNENAAFTHTRSQVRVLRRRRQPGEEEPVYFVSSSAYDRLPSYFRRLMTPCVPAGEERVFRRFYPLSPDRPIEIMPLLRVLELLGLASYEIRGGEKAEVFLRVNDPSKLSLLASGNYRNAVLQAIHQRHKHQQELLSAFFLTEMTTPERWELIEEYFLGNEDYVDEKLGLQR